MGWWLGGSRSKQRPKPNPSATYRDVHTEVAVLHHVSHPHVTHLVDFFETTEEYVIGTEYVSGPTLYQYLRRRRVEDWQSFTADQSFRFFHQLLSAVDACHARGIAHRDIKPENILMSADCTILKLADFGLAGVVGRDELMKSSCGSPHYIAPEIIRGEKYSGPACDVWSLGVVLYAIHAGCLPFVHPDMPTVLEKICDGKYHVPRGFCAELRDLLSRMLCLDFRRRITVEEIKLHPWWLENCIRLTLNPMGVGEVENSANCSTAIGEAFSGESADGLSSLDSNDKGCSRKPTMSCKAQNLHPSEALQGIQLSKPRWKDTRVLRKLMVLLQEMRGKPHSI